MVIIQVNIDYIKELLIQLCFIVSGHPFQHPCYGRYIHLPFDLCIQLNVGTYHQPRTQQESTTLKTEKSVVMITGKSRTSEQDTNETTLVPDETTIKPLNNVTNKTPDEITKVTTTTPSVNNSDDLVDDDYDYDDYEMNKLRRGGISAVSIFLSG